MNSCEHVDMKSHIVRIARERYTLRNVLSAVVFLTIMYGITRNEGIVIGLTVGLAVTEIANMIRETPSIDSRWATIGIGAFVTLASLAWFWYEVTVSTVEGKLWLPGLMAVVGVWFLFDGYRESGGSHWDHDKPRDDMSVNEMMVAMNHAHLVVQELKSGPKTIKELAAACDLTESRVREALDVGSDDGTIYRVDAKSTDDTERYAVDESMLGSVAFIRINGKRVLRRLARPFRR